MTVDILGNSSVHASISTACSCNVSYEVRTVREPAVRTQSRRSHHRELLLSQAERFTCGYHRLLHTSSAFSAAACAIVMSSLWTLVPAVKRSPLCVSLLVSVRTSRGSPSSPIRRRSCHLSILCTTVVHQIRSRVLCSILLVGCGRLRVHSCGLGTGCMS